MVVPFVWMLSTSLKDNSLIFSFPPKWIPDQIKWRNYQEAAASFPYYQYFWNTFYITALTIAGVLLTSALAGYAFARMQFPLRNQLFLVVLSIMMIPGQVIMIPIFLLVKDLGWMDSHLSLIVPSLVSPFGIFLMRQFYLSMPKELEDAASIDGCNPIRTFFSIFLPLSKPALATISVFTFMGTWNSFLWPLLLISTKSKQLLTVGLLQFQNMYATQYNLLMAATLLVLLPVFLVYMFAQRYFVEGIAVSGVKG
ncbi:ABC transporter permease subunit [Paenibacillus sp. LMG 31460]|uniref:ABC transporter permease subunit n=2 Tax=Paenibacillus germinis TaxID=2654979 RepID=A0ABX1Z8V0_9BACL|nr:ABC transporter permease subunit [Paenibacillus germinis]